MKLTVKGQRLIADSGFYVADTINYLTADVVYSSEWLQLTDIWLHFRCGPTAFEVLVVDGKITADSQINLTAGIWDLYLHGIVREGIEVTQRITSSQIRIVVKATGIVSNEPLPIPPSFGEEVYAKSEEAFARANTAIATADDADRKADDAVATADDADRKANDAVATANTADGKADQAIETANTADGKADEAVRIANEAVGVADDYKDIAIANAEKARGYAEGKKLNGDDNPEYAEANAKHYAEEAADSATDADTARGLAQDAQSDAETARDTAKKWAVGTEDTEAEQHDNSAKDHANAASESADDASDFADEAEAWTRGTVGGVAVGAEADQHENNAKYYAEHAQGIAEQMATDVEEIIGDISTNKTDITLLKKEVKDTSKMIAEANPNGEPKATVSGINSVSLPKNVTQSGGKVTVEGELVKNETSYNPETWAEWTKPSGVIADSTGAEIVAVNGVYRFINRSVVLKPATKYLILINVVSNSLAGGIIVDPNEHLGISHIITQLGNNKIVKTTKESITVNSLVLTTTNSETTGNSIKLKDIRIYELPTNSQIETDANTLTADQLSAKYPFIQGTQSVTKTRVRGVGKNLFDKDDVVIGDLSASTGNEFISSLYRRSKYIPISPNTAYYYQNVTTWVTYDINFVRTGGFYTSAIPNSTITTSSNSSYIRVVCLASNVNVVQLEKGSTATPYTPYTSNSVYLAPHVLYSLPNGVKDTIDTNGVLTKRVKKDTASGIVAVNTTNYPLAKNGGQFVNYLTAGGMETGIIGTDSTTGAGTLYYELALPVTTPNQATGTLILYPNGQVEIDNGMADGGLYTDSITILNTAYPIKTLERIQKITDGYSVDINVSTAVIALDGLSFTHPDLSNDVIVFEYTYDYEGVNGEAEVEYFDSRLVIADTENGKFYKYKPVITNGVIASWAVEEV